MIRKNESLNCACCNPSECPNGSDYADRINPISGRKTCPVVEKVKPIDIKALEAEIELNLEIRQTEKRFKTKEEMILEDEKNEQIHTVNKHDGEKNDPRRIAELLEIAEIIKLVDLSHRNPPKCPKTFNFILNDEYQNAVVRQETRRELLREKLGISDTYDSPNWQDIDDEYFVLPNPHRNLEPRKPMWAHKLGRTGFELAREVDYGFHYGIVRIVCVTRDPRLGDL